MNEKREPNVWGKQENRYTYRREGLHTNNTETHNINVHERREMGDDRIGGRAERKTLRAEAKKYDNYDTNRGYIYMREETRRQEKHETGYAPRRDSKTRRYETSETMRENDENTRIRNDERRRAATIRDTTPRREYETNRNDTRRGEISRCVGGFIASLARFPCLRTHDCHAFRVRGFVLVARRK